MHSIGGEVVKLKSDPCDNMPRNYDKTIRSVMVPDKSHSV